MLLFFINLCYISQVNCNTNYLLLRLKKKKYKWLINVISAIICYVALILNWHLYRMINHYMDNGEPLNKEIDWHIYNALYALFIDTCIFLCLVNMCERYIK